ncbi:MAG: hypothetical protein HZA13_06825 [Nitrospirae bacterium]|nr:hypothetical protein [Nitrospirota bacterium]
MSVKSSKKQRIDASGTSSSGAPEKSSARSPKKECKKQKVIIVEGTGREQTEESERNPSEIAYRSREELGLSGAKIARHLGVNTSSINRALARSDATYK